MKCPYCKTEMRSGYVHNPGQPVQWIPDGQRPSPWRNGFARNAVQLGEASFWRESKATTFYCPSCDIVIIPAK